VGEAGALTAFPSASRLERLLLVLTPAIAMAAVALGLRLGAPESLRAAVVYGAAQSGAGTGLAWPIVVFDEERGAREPAKGVPVDVVARTRASSAPPVSWHGVTNGDGVIEALLDRAAAPGEEVTLEVRSGKDVLARGDAAAPPFAAPAPREPGWLRFARREGAVALDVALLGQRAAPAFPAALWVHATDRATHAPLARVVIALEGDPSVALAGAPAEPTDTAGWTRVAVVPAGLAVTATFDARSPDGRSGTWIGGLFMSPGAPQIETRARWAPDEPVGLDVTMPTVRPGAYLEIDDARGRAWAAALPLEARADGTSHATVAAPSLAPGLYWAVAAADANGANAAGAWSAGTIVRPFFVAASDDAALRFGSEPSACAAPRDPRETSNAVGACLALVAPTPAPRWLALDGSVVQRALDRDARTRGLAVALGALAIAILLESTLLLRAAHRSDHGGPRLDDAAQDAVQDELQGELHDETYDEPQGKPLRQRGTVLVAILVGLLGFALLAAFIVRV
jgi:hypothetical protein